MLALRPAYPTPDPGSTRPGVTVPGARRLEEDPGLGAVGPLIARPDERDRLFYAGGYVRSHNWSFQLREDPPALADWKGAPPQTVDFLQTGGMLMRSEVARQVGEMDERFWYWFEDVDYTIRINRHGWRVECLPAAVGWESFGDPPPYIATRNTLLTIANNAPKRFVVRELARQLFQLARDAATRDRPRDDLWPRVRGLLAFCFGRWGAPPASLSGKRHAPPTG